MTLLEMLRAMPHRKKFEGKSVERLNQAVQAVFHAFPEVGKVAPATLEQVKTKIATAVRDWEWDSVTVGEVGILASAAFGRAEKLDPSTFDFVRREVHATTNPVLLDAAAEGYIAGWSRGGQLTKWLAGIIQERSSHLSNRWQSVFLSIPEVLDPTHAPEQLAERMVTQPDPYRWLTGVGVASPHSGNLMWELHVSWLRILPEIKTDAQVDQVFRWILPGGRARASDEMAASAIEKLLTPWLHKMPEQEYRKELLDRITSAYGDPRNQRPEFWSLVGAPCRGVVVRWLAGASMDALLSVITKSTANHMWPPRHHFWKGLFNRGLVNEAWVALSPAAADIAADMFAKSANAASAVAGKQTSKVRKDTCLLIMRIGRHIVVEGSHDYRVHVFSGTDRRTPKLYQTTYDAEALILPVGHTDTRIHDPYGHWMKWVEERVVR
ncbi:EH signature domain-containing protein [Agrobacterium tumefaciens]|nr:EH signature domain-containing protein [Agrobacterium tumefaciens]